MTAPEKTHIDCSQVCWGINIWCGVFGDGIIGPYIFMDTVNGKKYVQQMLADVIGSFTLNLLRNELHQIWFQHCGAPSEFTSSAENWLCNNFPIQWIGHDGVMLCPPQSLVSIGVFPLGLCERSRLCNWVCWFELYVIRQFQGKFEQYFGPGMIYQNSAKWNSLAKRLPPNLQYGHVS